ncbi:MAG: LamG domain-containing protein, partial [Candidatus Thermoplasmatota archaeon]
KFDGVDDYVQISTPAGSGLTNLENGTVSLWFKPSVDYNPTTDWDMLVGAWPDSTDGNWNLALGYQTRCKIDFQIRGGNIIQSDSDTFNSGVWYHVAVTWEKNGKLKMYIDGVLQSDVKDNIAPYAGNANKNIQIAQNFGWGNNFNGTIDEVLIINRSLSTDEIYQLYLGGYNRTSSLHRMGSYDDLNTMSFDLKDKDTAKQTSYDQIKMKVLVSIPAISIFVGSSEKLAKPSSPSIKINNDEVYTTSNSVTLSLNGINISEMRFSNDQFTWSAWEPFSNSKQYSLPFGDGKKTVYYQGRSIHGVLSSIVSDDIKLDTTLPTGSISINDGARYTNKNSVTLKLSANDANGIASMSFSDDGINWLSEPYKSSKAYTLPGIDGEKEVYVKFRDNAGLESLVYKDNIILDTKPPTGFIILPEYTNKTRINLTLVASDANGIAEMRLSNNETFGDWETYKQNIEWEIEGIEGINNVSVEYRDSSGLTTTANGSTIYDKTNPKLWLRIDEYTSKPIIEVKLDYDDDVKSMRLSNDGIWDYEGWEKASKTKVWVLSQGDGKKRIYCQVMDNAGNINESYAETILDTEVPKGSFKINDGALYTKSEKVELSFYSTEIIDKIRLSNDGLIWTDWFSYEEKYKWELDKGDGIKNVYAQYIDKAGIVSEILNERIILDTCAPMSEIDIPRYIANTTFELKWHGMDKGSGIAYYSLYYSEDGKNYNELIRRTKDTSKTFNGTAGKTYYFYTLATDNAGIVEEDEKIKEVTIDISPPKTELKVSKPYHSEIGGIYVRTTSLLSLKSNDELSGIKQIEYGIDGNYTVYTMPFSFLMPGFHILEYRGIDNVGNTEGWKKLRVQVDELAPITRIYVTAKEMPIYINSSFSLKLEAEDMTPNIRTYIRIDNDNWTLYSPQFSISNYKEGSHILSYYSIDAVENIEMATAIQVFIDNKAPNTTALFEKKWNNLDTTINLVGIDDGSGIKETYYRVNYGEWLKGNEIFLPASKDHSNDGLYNISYYSLDKAGNFEQIKQAEVGIDTIINFKVYTQDMIVGSDRVLIKGTGEEGAIVVIKDKRVTITGDFGIEAKLSIGENKIKIYSIDKAGNEKTIYRNITYYPFLYIFGFVGFLIAMLVIAFIYIIKGKIKAKPKKKEFDKCPYCNEKIKPKLDVCPYCERRIREEG